MPSDEDHLDQSNQSGHADSSLTSNLSEKNISATNGAENLRVPDAEIPDQGDDADAEIADRAETRPFAEAMHEVTWIKHGGIFLCDRYTFKYQKKHGSGFGYGQCQDCVILRQRLGRKNWIVNNRVMIQRKICSLKFANGLDGPVKGCPWKPGGLDHLCLDRSYYEPGEYEIKTKKSQTKKNADFLRVYGNARLADGAENLSLPDAEMPDEGGDADAKIADRAGMRPFEETTHEVTWVQDKSYFRCDRYIFRVQERHGYCYGKCRDCITLLSSLVRKKWIVNNRLITERTVCSLKFVNGLDGPVHGCPWKPGGFDHLCLKRKEFEEHVVLYKISSESFNENDQSYAQMPDKCDDPDAQMPDQDGDTDAEIADRAETRPFVCAMHEVTWVKDKRHFRCDRYIFRVQETDGSIYGKCHDCVILRQQLQRKKWIVNNKVITKRTVCSLKFVNGLDDVVQGCPWKPGGFDHLCLKRKEFEEHVVLTKISSESSDEDDQSDAQMPEQDDDPDGAEVFDEDNQSDDFKSSVEKYSKDRRVKEASYDSGNEQHDHKENVVEDGADVPDQSEGPGTENSDDVGEAGAEIAEQSETRPFEYATHEVTWVKDKSHFRCDRYIFRVHRLPYGIHGICRDCYILRARLVMNNWIVNNRLVTERTVSSLKFVNGLDGPVQGCPWKPGGLDHLCLDRSYYVNKSEISQTKKKADFLRVYGTARVADGAENLRVPDAEMPDQGDGADAEIADRAEMRPFEEATHEVTWIKHGSIFLCDRYTFKVRRMNSGFYGTCLDCFTLRDTLARKNWIVNNRVMIQRKICSLKFANGLDGPVKGCPWKPGGLDHLCLDRSYYEPGEYEIKTKKSQTKKNADFLRVYGNARLADGAENLSLPYADLLDQSDDADAKIADRAEMRPFEETTHEVTWVKDKSRFRCDRYIFKVHQRLGHCYGKCRDCAILHESLVRRNWIVNNRVITERTVCSLKFVNGMDGPVHGCPWKPGGFDHLCLKRKEFEEHVVLTKISRKKKKSEFLRENAHMLYGRCHDSDAETSDEDDQSDTQMPQQDDGPGDAESSNEDDQSDAQMPEQDDGQDDAEFSDEDDQSDDAESFDEENAKDRRVEEASYDSGNEQHNENVEKSVEDGADMPDQDDDPGTENSDDVGDADAEIADQSETRPFEEAMHEVTWIVYGKLFQCDLYQFEVCEQEINRKTVLLGRCRDCYILCRKLCKRQWIVADKRTSTLKFLNGLDDVVQGCPWKPGGLDHLCLKRNYYDRIMLQDVMSKRQKLTESRKNLHVAESVHITKKAPRKVKRANRRSKDDRTLKDITDESNFEQELELYRNPANNEKPKFTNTAIVKYYFVRPGNKCVAVKSDDIAEWMMQFTFYKNIGFEKVKKSVLFVFNQYAESFRRIPDQALWQLRRAVVEDIPKAVDQIEERPYVDGEHPVNWIEYGKSFECDKYIFEIKQLKAVHLTGICRACFNLRERIQRRNWTVGNQLITNTKVCCIRFDDGLDAPVKGCPWKPGGVDHLCLKRIYYDRLIREDIIRERMQKADELLQQAIAFLKEKYEKASADFDIEAQEKNMKKFIKRQTLVFEYKEGTKLCFLYFIIKNGVLKYIGLSTDFNTRFCRHSETLTIFEDDGEVHFYIAPLGKRNVMFISDLEAAFIRLSKAGVLGKEIIDVDIINIDNGQFESVDEVLKEIVEDPDHSEYPFMVDALNEILKISLIEDNRVKPSAKVKNTITGAKVILKNRLCRLEDIQQERISDPFATPQPLPLGHSGISALLATPQPQPLGHSVPVQPELKIPIKYEALNKLAESQFLQFPFNARQKRYYLYFLKKKNSKKGHRYGITSNPARRQYEHENNKTLDGEFEMIEVPFPAVNRLFVMDLEAALIRLSKKKRLNDGKENMNKERDNGNFQSNVLQYLVEQEDTKLIEALDQLIQWALKSDITVTSSLKRSIESDNENMNHSAVKRRMIFPSNLSSDRNPVVSETLDKHNFNFVEDI